MNQTEIEKRLERMRGDLKTAYELSRQGMGELAQAYVAMAANKLSTVVCAQYRIIPMTPHWGNSTADDPPILEPERTT
jgi:hypothetical protein